MDEILGIGSRGGGYEKTPFCASGGQLVPVGAELRNAAFNAFLPVICAKRLFPRAWDGEFKASAADVHATKIKSVPLGNKKAPPAPGGAFATHRVSGWPS